MFSHAVGFDAGDKQGSSRRRRRRCNVDDDDVVAVAAVVVANLPVASFLPPCRLRHSSHAPLSRPQRRWQQLWRRRRWSRRARARPPVVCTSDRRRWRRRRRQRQRRRKQRQRRLFFFFDPVFLLNLPLLVDQLAHLQPRGPHHLRHRPCHLPGNPHVHRRAAVHPFALDVPFL